MTKAEIRFVQSLRQKKYRDEHNLFVAEGKKLVSGLWHHLKPHSIYTTDIDSGGFQTCPRIAALISEAEMQKITAFATPSSVLGIFEKPHHNIDSNLDTDWALALDGVQDPANVGAIIRLCDWFGITTLLCSPHTADCYAPKVVQATMGAIARIRVLYVDLAEFLPHAKHCIYGTFLEGNNIYTADLGQGGIVVLGSEGQGISQEVAALVHRQLHIPAFAADRVSESLNVASAAAIVCSEIRRNVR